MESLPETSSENNLVWRRKGEEGRVDLRNGRVRIWWAVLVRVGNRFKSLEAMARVFSGDGRNATHLLCLGNSITGPHTGLCRVLF